MQNHRNKCSTDQREVATMQKLFHKWPRFRESGRFALALIYSLLVTLALIIAAGAPHPSGGH